MTEALKTLSTYSRELCSMYQREQETAKNPEVKAALDLAVDYECRLAEQLEEEVTGVAGKLQNAKFKWHDKKMLLELPERLERPALQQLDDVITLVDECGRAALGYCHALTASTNSSEVLEFIDSVRLQREQYLKDFVRQAGRGFQ